MLRLGTTAVPLEWVEKLLYVAGDTCATSMCRAPGRFGMLSVVRISRSTFFAGVFRGSIPYPWFLAVTFEAVKVDCVYIYIEDDQGHP